MKSTHLPCPHVRSDKHCAARPLPQLLHVRVELHRVVCFQRHRLPGVVDRKKDGRKQKQTTDQNNHSLHRLPHKTMRKQTHTLEASEGLKNNTRYLVYIFPSCPTKQGGNRSRIRGFLPVILPHGRKHEAAPARHSNRLNRVPCTFYKHEKKESHAREAHTHAHLRSHKNRCLA